MWYRVCIKIIGVYTIQNELSCAVYGFNSLKFVPLSYKLIYREWMSKRKRKNWQKFCHAALLRFVECVWVSWCLHSINFRTVPASSTTIRNHSKLKRNECEVGKPLVIAAHNAIFHYYLYTYEVAITNAHWIKHIVTICWSEHILMKSCHGNVHMTVVIKVPFLWLALVM